MPDPRPYIPESGARLEYRKQMYMLRWKDGARVMFNLQALTEAKRPTYRLELQKTNDPYHFDVFSLRTGKRMPNGIACYMRQRNPPNPLPKWPWWHEREGGAVNHPRRRAVGFRPCSSERKHERK